MKIGLVVLASGLLLSTVGLLNEVQASGTSSVTPDSVAAGQPVEFKATVKTQSKACQLSLTDTQQVKIGTLKVSKGQVISTIDTTSLAAGAYRAVLRCGKDRAIVSPAFTVTGSPVPAGPIPARLQSPCPTVGAVDGDLICSTQKNKQVWILRSQSTPASVQGVWGSATLNPFIVPSNGCKELVASVNVTNSTQITSNGLHFLIIDFQNYYVARTIVRKFEMPGFNFDVKLPVCSSDWLSEQKIYSCSTIVAGYVSCANSPIVDLIRGRKAIAANTTYSFVVQRFTDGVFQDSSVLTNFTTGN